MDEACQNCPALCETRERVVHGWGDVGGDFLFVGERPDEAADEGERPFAGSPTMTRLLETLGFLTDDPEEPIRNAFLTHLTRCRDPDRTPTDDEIANCEPFLNAEIRMINPEIIIPVGEPVLRELATEYTTTPAEEFGHPEDHARTIRGRGFELVPMVAPARASEEQIDAFRAHFEEVLDRDYRQTKGRRGR
jgi:uracil-DNA glycosylase family 4